MLRTQWRSVKRAQSLIPFHSSNQSLPSLIPLIHPHLSHLHKHLPSLIPHIHPHLSHNSTYTYSPSLIPHGHLTTGMQLGPAVEARQRRSIEREARRRRRREARERKRQLVHDEGMSSDDELLETNRMKFAAGIGQKIQAMMCSTAWGSPLINSHLIGYFLEYCLYLLIKSVTPINTLFGFSISHKF